MALAPTADRVARTIEALLSTRLFVQPQLAAGQIYFLSNLGGHLSLYRMDEDGSVPEPLLPPRLALQNPELVTGRSFVVLPELDRIVVMLDLDGDENYEPHVVPLDGGFPEPLNAEAFGRDRTHLLDADVRAAVGYGVTESRDEAVMRGVRVRLTTGEVETLGESAYGAFPVAWAPDHGRVLLGDGYTPGDTVLYERDPATGERRMLWGVALEDRERGSEHPPSGFRAAAFTPSGEGLLLVTSLFDDGYGPAYLPLDGGELEPVTLAGAVHEGAGELEGLDRIEDDRYVARFNIDGVSWAYVAEHEEADRRLVLGRVLCGRGELSGGVLHGLRHDPATGRFAAAFCTATTPTQLHVLPAEERNGLPGRLTLERPLGLDPAELAPGEDASFVSHDGLRVSARLYLPPESAGHAGPHPVVLYVHGGPQSQERPDFAWFSMPLIQVLARAGLAVFVPNARGSTGYGLDYMQRVNRDWGGQDRLDHVHALTEVLSQDERLDTRRAAVIGRSYGGYMTLMLAGRHPELWSAAVDMFGPYDLTTFAERTPPTWKPFLALTLGDPGADADFFRERSPRTYVDAIRCPLLVIQGRNDPRVVEVESADLVAELRAAGKTVEYLVFEDEGHDVLKLANRIRCYETIAGFFDKHLQP
jgi:dipeptidyl aminopeptidase/acylaminoacyl peptidase